MKKEGKVNSIAFYDVSTTQNLGTSKKSRFIDINELIKERMAQRPDIFREAGLVDEIKTFDFYGINKPAYWEKVLKTIVYCLSGQIADRQEILRGRQIIYHLPKLFKRKYLNEQFVLAFLPYIIIGFKTHTSELLKSNSNSISDVSKFITHIYNSECVEIISLLCAHRGFSPQGQHLLIDSVCQQKAQKSLNFQKGILANIPGVKKRRISWFQQGPTEMSASNMFPEMFIQYMVDGKVPDMILLLEKHFSECRLILESDVSGFIDGKLVNLDILTNRTCAFLDCRYGVGWRSANFELLKCSTDPLVELALTKVIPEIRRLIPFNGHSFDRNIANTMEVYLNKNLLRARDIDGAGIHTNVGAITEKAINWFYGNQLINIAAKALYETAFYYVWGSITASQKSSVAVGIDRDHAEYQNSAWEMGYKHVAGHTATLNTVLYARRNQKETPGGSLEETSFRQFWR